MNPHDLCCVCDRPFEGTNTLQRERGRTDGWRDRMKGHTFQATGGTPWCAGFREGWYDADVRLRYTEGRDVA